MHELDLPRGRLSGGIVENEHAKPLINERGDLMLEGAVVAVRNQLQRVPGKGLRLRN